MPSTDFATARHARLWPAVATQTAGEDLAHDADHVLRVYAWAVRIARAEGEDVDLCGAAALVHDLVNIPKESRDRPLGGELSAVAGKELLEDAGYTKDEVHACAEAVRTSSWSRGLAPVNRIGVVLQDADRLDAIGAIGAARNFATAQAMASRGARGASTIQRTPWGVPNARSMTCGTRWTTGPGNCCDSMPDSIPEPHASKPNDAIDSYWSSWPSWKPNLQAHPHQAPSPAEDGRRTLRPATGCDSSPHACPLASAAFRGPRRRPLHTGVVLTGHPDFEAPRHQSAREGVSMDFPGGIARVYVGTTESAAQEWYAEKSAFIARHKPTALIGLGDEAQQVEDGTVLFRDGNVAVLVQVKSGARSAPRPCTRPSMIRRPRHPPPPPWPQTLPGTGSMRRTRPTSRMSEVALAPERPGLWFTVPPRRVITWGPLGRSTVQDFDEAGVAIQTTPVRPAPGFVPPVDAPDQRTTCNGCRQANPTPSSRGSAVSSVGPKTLFRVTSARTTPPGPMQPRPSPLLPPDRDQCRAEAGQHGP